MVRVSKSVLAAVILLVPAPVGAEQLHAYFSSAEDGVHTNLTISPCTGEEVAECVSHTLECGTGEWPLLQFSIIAGPVEKIAKAMIFGTNGRPQGAVKLADGKTIDLQFSTVHLDANDMDGGWILTTGIDDPAPLFDAVTDKSAEGATLVVGGEAFTLAPEKGDGVKLRQFKNECAKLH